MSNNIKEDLIFVSLQLLIGECQESFAHICMLRKETKTFSYFDKVSIKLLVDDTQYDREYA